MNNIKFNNVSFSYEKDDKNMILDHISFSIENGKYVGIVGKNGSGKSTIAKLIAGLIKPLNGEIIINKDNRIGYVFQNPDNQFVGVTVADDIAFGLENLNVSQSEMDIIIDRVLSQVDMINFKNYEPQLLSGGQKQRIAIASNLAMNLSIIIFDESTSMLDPIGKKEINELIEEIRNTNKDMIIIKISHDLEEISKCDNILVINNHKIVFNDKPENLFINYNLCIECNLNIPFKYELINKLKSIGMNLSLNDNDNIIRNKINEYQNK